MKKILILFLFSLTLLSCYSQKESGRGPADPVCGDTLPPVFPITVHGIKIQYMGYFNGRPYVMVSVFLDTEYGDSLSIFRVVQGEEVLMHRFTYLSKGSVTSNWHFNPAMGQVYDIVVRGTGNYTYSQTLTIPKTHVIFSQGQLQNYSITGQPVNDSYSGIIIQKSLEFRDARKIIIIR